MNAAFTRACDRARAAFLARPGVLGLGPGPKFTGGQMVAWESIVVLVERKRPPDELPAGELLPGSFEDFPVDVREPRLTIEPAERFDPEHPDSELDLCLTDYQLIDWARREAGARAGELERRRTGDHPDMPPAPTTAVNGNLFVIHDPGGTLVDSLGIKLLQAYTIFRGTFGDDYDFVTYFIDSGSGLPNIGNAQTWIYNDVLGTRVLAIDNRAAWGSGRLLGRTHHTWFSLRTLLHELAHQWCMYVNFRATPTAAPELLLHQDAPSSDTAPGTHWGRWPDDDHSSLDQDRADWSPAAGGTFSRVRYAETNPAQAEWFAYNPLDQYLMGLIPASAVPDILVVQNPTPAIPASETANPFQGGPCTPTPGPRTVSIAQIQAEEGVRTPDYLGSQRVFHQAFIVVTKAAPGAAGTFIGTSQDWRERHTTNFRRATGGRAVVDTSLVRANFRDIYLKDNAADTGAGPSTGIFWLSPDLWVRNANDTGTDHQAPIRGQDNFVRVRVRNRGTTPYNDVTVNVYKGNFATLQPGTQFLYPVDWYPPNRIGSATIPTVPAAAGGVDGEAIVTIPWAAADIPPAAGWHPCLLAEIIPMEVEPSGLHYVWENRKLAQRNLTIIDAPLPAGGGAGAGAYMFVSEFTVGHHLLPARVARLRLVDVDRSDRVRLFLDPGPLIPDLYQYGEALYVEAPLAPGLVPGGEHAVVPVDDPRIRSAGGDGVAPELSNRYALRGLRPVSLNGVPLLALTEDQGEMLLRLGERQMPTLRLIGLVARDDGGDGIARYHLIEEAPGGSAFGGLSLAVRR